MKKEKIVTILSIFTVIFTIIGGTLAYWSWDTTEAQKTLVTFSVADNFSCSVDGGGSITSATYTVAPASCTNSTYAIKREVTTTVEVDGNEPVTMDLVININNLGTGLTNSENFMYALTEDSSSCSNNVISQGTFNGKTNGNTISILNKTYEETTTETYYLWIWLDAVETSSTTREQPFNLSLGGTCTDTPMDYFYAVYVSGEDYRLRFIDDTEENIRGKYDNDDSSIIAMYKVYNNAVYTEVNPVPWSEYASDFETVSVDDTISPSNTQYWFYGFTDVADMYLANLDTSNVTSMSHMFYQTSYSDGDFDPTGLSSWNTSKVKDMSYMFSMAGTSTFAPGNISEWNTANVMNMAGMFNETGETSMITMNLSNWNVGKVRNMSAMFNECGEGDFDIGNLDNWDVSNVTDMTRMFYYIGEGGFSFNIGDLSDWDVSNVTDMSGIFGGVGNYADTFNIGDLSNWDVSNVTNMYNMFGNACWTATTCDVGDLSDWNTNNVTSMKYMFYNFGYNDRNLDISYVSNWDVSNVTDMSGMFNNTGYNIANFSLDLSKWNTSKVTDMNHMFNSTGYKSSSFELIGLNRFNTKNVTDMSAMFAYAGYSASTFNIGDISGWDVSKVTNYNSFNTGVESKVTLPLAWQS